MSKSATVFSQNAPHFQKMGRVLLLVQLALSICLLTNIRSVLADDVTSRSETSQYTLGTELDALPFITGGYYFSVVGGYDHFRLRAIISLVNPPGFAYDSAHFSNLSLHAYAAVVDYFFKPDLNGYWIGGGIERWLASIHGMNGQSTGSFQEWVATLGVGYVWYFYSNFYLNPWVAGHLRVGGDSQSIVGTQIYSVNTLQGEGSVKLGWHF